MIFELFILTLLVFVASIVGTFSGFGTSTIMVPVMLLFFPLSVTLLFVKGILVQRTYATRGLGRIDKSKLYH